MSYFTHKCWRMMALWYSDIIRCHIANWSLVLLSPALTAVLYDLSRQIPQLKKDIQDGLLKMLSLVLMHKPLRHPGMPKGLAYQLSSPSLTNIPEASDVGSITLALRTLGSFEFEGMRHGRCDERLSYLVV